MSFRSTILFGIAAFAIGASIAVALFPADMLLGQWSWAGNVRGDIAASQIGYMYFALDEWRWPILDTKLLNPPIGVNAIYTDPIPVLAILGKIVYSITGHMPFYFGPWVLVCFGLQSFVGYLIFRQLGFERIHALVSCSLLVLLPSFIYRIGHIPLLAQFVILLTFLCYLRVVGTASRREITFASLGIGGIAFLNPYLMVMSAPIFVAGLAEAARRGRLRWFEVIVFASLILAGALAFVVVFGIVGNEPVPRGGGFGRYSLNLLSPVTPQFSIIPIYRHFLLDMTGGQYEGFNYLGAGVLLLLLYGVIFRFRDFWRLLARHRFLAAAMVALTLYAASNRVWIGSLYIGNLGYDELPIVDIITSTFRASGRFFWPVAFILVIAAVAVLARARTRTLAILLGIILVQIVDIVPILERTQAKVRFAEAGISSWQAAMESHDELVLYPEHHCADPSDRTMLLQLQVRAARVGIPTNGAYLNRGDPECRQSALAYSERFDAEAVTHNPLVVLFKKSYPPILLEEGLARGFSCRDAGNAFVCSKRNDAAFIRLGSNVMRADPIRLGVQYTAGGDVTGSPFMVAGWSGIEQDPARWGEGPTTAWAGHLPHVVCKEFTFQADVSPLAKGDYAVRNAHAFLNGRKVGEVSLATGDRQSVILRVPLGGECIETFKFKLQFEDFRSPKDLGINTDQRPLTWRYTTFSFDAQ